MSYVNSTPASIPSNNVIGVENWEFICFTFLYGLTLIFGVFGNVVLIVSIFRNKTNTMRSTTNYFIANLAISDLLIAILVIPYRYNEFVFKRWQLGRFLCAVLPTVEKMLFTVSILQMLAIAYARHRIVVFPFVKSLAKRTTIILIILVWVIAISGGIPVAVKIPYAAIFGRKVIPNCAPKWSSAYQKIYYRILFFLNVIPLLMTYCLYGHIYYVMRRRAGRSNEINSHNPVAIATQRNVLRMLITMLVISSLCWMPYGAMIFILSVITFRHPHGTLILAFLKWIAVFNCCHNPFICWIFSKSYQQEMLCLFGVKKAITMSNLNTTRQCSSRYSEHASSFRNRNHPFNHQEKSKHASPNVTKESRIVDTKNNSNGTAATTNNGNVANNSSKNCLETVV